MYLDQSQGRTSDYHRMKQYNKDMKLKKHPHVTPSVLSLHQNPPSSPHRLTTDKRFNLICPVILSLLLFPDLKFSSWGQRTPVPISPLQVSAEIF